MSKSNMEQDGTEIKAEERNINGENDPLQETTVFTVITKQAAAEAHLAQEVAEGIIPTEDGLVRESAEFIDRSAMEQETQRIAHA